MDKNESVRSALLQLLKGIVDESENASRELTSEDPLIGDDASISSRELVEFLLEVEDYASEHLGVNFDWTTNSALSFKRSPFRSVASLTEHLLALEQADADS